MGDNVSLIDGHIDEIPRCKLCGIEISEKMVLCKSCLNKSEAFIDSIESALDYNLSVTDEEFEHYRKLLNILSKS